MRILLINQPFWPDIVATAQHMADWTEHLVAQGHEVSVIASRSVYGRQGAVLGKREMHKGVHIHRVGSNLFAKGRMMTRLVDFGLFHVRALWRAMTLPRQDVVVCLTTPPFIGVVGMMLKLLRGTRYVQYEMDLYPDVPIALGVWRKESLVARVLERIHRRLLRSADRVVVLGRCMQRVIAEKGIDEKKLVLVVPWSDPEEIVPVPHGQNAFRRQHGLEGKFVVMYSGNLGLGHDIATVCAAMEQLTVSGDPGDRAMHFVFIGGGRRMAEVQRFVAEKKLANALTLEYQPRADLSRTLSAADVHLITQAPSTTGLIVPSKFYGILAAGRPSIYIGPADAEVALAIAEQHVGAVLEVGQTERLIEALRNAQRAAPENVAAMEMRCRHAAERYSRRNCCAALTAMIDDVGAGRR